MLIGSTFPAHGRYNPSLATHFFRYFRLVENSGESEPLRTRCVKRWRANGAVLGGRDQRGEFDGAQVPPSPRAVVFVFLFVETLVSVILD